MKFSILAAVSVFFIAALALANEEWGGMSHPPSVNRVPLPSPGKRQTNREAVVARMQRRSRQDLKARGASPSDAVTPSITETNRGYTQTYTFKYRTVGFTENLNNPGNNRGSNAVPHTTSFPGSNTLAQATQLCTDFTYNSDPSDSTLGITYYSFNLYYYQTGPNANTFTCTAFYDSQSQADGSYFNVANPDVGVSVLYSFP